MKSSELERSWTLHRWGFPSRCSALIRGLALCLFFSMLFTDSPAMGVNLDPLRTLPVQDGGRIKPIDTAARESIRLVTGKERYRGHDPLALCLAIERDPAAWQREPLIHVPYIELRAMLGLAEDAQHATPATVRTSEKLSQLIAEAQQQRQAAQVHNEDPRLSRLQEKALELSQRLAEFDRLASGQRFAIYPKAKEGEAWESAGQSDEKWRAVLTAAATSDDAFQAAAFELGKTTTIAFTPKGMAIDPAVSPYHDAMKREVAYHRIHPFRYAWVLYLASLLVLSVSLMISSSWPYRVGMALLILGIGWSIFSFIWRCSITGWAPVTNIYETVIWVALIGAITAVGIELFSKGGGGGEGRAKIPAIAGALAATASGLVADIMPPEYGSSMRTLAPVLQSNFWLTVHVLTIVSSYAGFLVALVLGNIVITQFAFRPGQKTAIALNLKHLYRAMQVGVLLVFVGTVLGGLWADVSWGRFWGWDPKEVWALIILLTYLALLHGRYAGWVGQFGLAAGSILSFLTVLMSWYGVNFVLGAGLHTYGFNTGGQLYVAAFTAVQVAYLALCYAFHRRHQPRTSTLSAYEKPSLTQSL